MRKLGYYKRISKIVAIIYHILIILLGFVTLIDLCIVIYRGIRYYFLFVVDLQLLGYLTEIAS